MQQNRLIALVAILMALVLGIALWPDGRAIRVSTAPDGDRTIHVTGTGRLDLKPDTASVSFGTTNEARTAKEAYKQASKTANEMVAKLKAVGIEEKEVRTSINLHPNYDYSSKYPRVIGYNGSVDFSVDTRKIDLVGDLVDAIVDAGANRIGGISFRLKDQAAFEKQVLDAALEDAKEKAEGIAAKTGARIIGIKRVNVQPTGGGGPIYFKNEGLARGAMDGAAPPVMPGMTEFMMIVDVEYLIE